MSGASLTLNKNSRFIKAGAGAGKTTKLISDFIEFVKAFSKQNKRYPRVAITTFTRKATQEVKERLLVRAYELNENDIFRYINKKSYVHISTIHGLLHIFLSQHLDKIGFPQEFRILDDLKYNKIIKKILNEQFKKNPEYMELLHSYSFKDLVKVAIDGVNKKSQYQNLTFVSEEQLQKLSNDIKQNLLNVIEKIHHNTFDYDALSEDWKTYYSHLKDIKTAIEKNNEKSLLDLLVSFPNKPRWSEKKPSLNPEAHDLIEVFRKESIKQKFDTEEYIKYHQKVNQLFYQLIVVLESEIKSYKKSTGEITISDMELFSLQIIQQHPSSAREFSNSWDYFMIDEYQDTSPLQVEILNLLIQDKPCFVVGDPQQSIYLFRGARSEVFEQKRQEMTKASAEVLVLDKNYRSEPELMSYMNDFFTNFSSQFEPMQLKEKSEFRYDVGAEVFYIKSYNEELAVISHIQNLIKQQVSPKDICVLTRSNKKIIQLAQEAKKYNLPVQLQIATGYEEKREVQDLICFHKFLNNPHDDQNLVALLRSPWLYCSDSEILKTAHIKPQNTNLRLSFFQKICSRQDSEEIKKIVESLLSYLELFENFGALQALVEFLKRTEFVACSSFYDSSGKRESNIFKYLASVATEERRSGFSLGQFLEEHFSGVGADLGSAGAEAQPVLQPDCVSLMTVHMAKGLQFKHVLVLGFADKIQTTKQVVLSFDEQQEKFSLAVKANSADAEETDSDNEPEKLLPSAWANEVRKQLNSRETEESERVLYVAMTRAVESLSMFAEVPRPDSRTKNIGQNTWYSKTIWPQDGDTVKVINGQNIRIKSCFVDDKPHVYIKNNSLAKAARNLWYSEKNISTSARQKSVTDLIENKAQDFMGANETDYLQLQAHLQKAKIGTDLHRIFESLKYLSYEDIKSKISKDDLKLVDYIYKQDILPIKEILELGFNEWGFGLQLAYQFLQGQIDLWAELSDSIYILDFKTGSSAYSEKAFYQMTVYALALAQMKQISQSKKIILGAIYPAEENIKLREFNGASHLKSEAPDEIKSLFTFEPSQDLLS